MPEEDPAKVGTGREAARELALLQPRCPLRLVSGLNLA